MSKRYFGVSAAPRAALVAAMCIGLVMTIVSRDAAASTSIPNAIAAYAADTLGFTMTPVVGKTVTSGAFALAGWTAGESGGEALLQDRKGNWVVTVMVGGSIADVPELVKYGVDRTDAQSLASQMHLAEAGVSLDVAKRPNARQVQIEAKDFTLLVHDTVPVSGRMLKAYDIASEALKRIDSLSVVKNNLARYHIVFQDQRTIIRLHLIPGSNRTIFHLRCGSDFCPIIDMTVDAKLWKLASWSR